MADLSGTRPILCGDCGAPDPDWASVNRGLFLCNDCCFIHRSLGPQYSHIKWLKCDGWEPALKTMVTTLAAGGANHVWEHLLLDRSKAETKDPVKKPFPYDTLEVKRKFIQLKHFQFAFVPRPPVDQIEVKSQELHSTVRTASVDTTLRLLAGGADPNYFHPMKGTRPIHVAARNGQASQVELLYLHGANPAAPDYLGQTPMDHAIAAGHKDLALRLLQLRYSLTDQLTFFVVQVVPDHQSNKHILVPIVKNKNLKHDVDFNKLAPYLLEQLAADLLDEVGRRQIERVVTKKFGSESPKFSIAFLPVNPHYPSVRNQARQKFARLTDSELCCMISGVLSETEKRHRKSGGEPPGAETDTIFRRMSATTSLPPCNGNQTQVQVKVGPEPGNLLDDDDYPLYDSVASDEDIILAEQQLFLAQEKSEKKASLPSNSSLLNANTNAKTDPISNAKFESEFTERFLRARLTDTGLQLLQLQEINRKLERECMAMREMVKSSLKDNLELLSQVQRVFTSGEALNCCCGVAGHGTPIPKRGRGAPNKPGRPSSMVELAPFHLPPISAPGAGAAAKTPSTSVEDLNASSPPKVTNAYEATTRTVDLIKELITSAMNQDIPQVRRASLEISTVINDFTQILMENPEIKHDVQIMTGLQKLCFKSLKLVQEIATMVHAGPDNVASDPELVPTVKQLCLEVGAAMREVVYMFPVVQEDDKDKMPKTK